MDVAVFDEELRQLISDMFETMYAEEGIGLAAPQIGVSKRFFVMDVGEDGTALAIVNPVIVEEAGSEKGEEGCLSLPGMVGTVERAMEVVVEGYDPEGKPLRLEASGLVARCMQHEIDHLDGVLFIDKLSPMKRKMLLSKWKKSRKEAELG